MCLLRACIQACHSEGCCLQQLLSSVSCLPREAWTRVDRLPCHATLQENVGLNLIHLLGDTDTLAEHSGVAQVPVTLQELCSRCNSSSR